MFGRCSTLFDVRGEDLKRFVVEVTHIIYIEKEYGQQLDIEEEIVQTLDAGK